MTDSEIGYGALEKLLHTPTSHLPLAYGTTTASPMRFGLWYALNVAYNITNKLALEHVRIFVEASDQAGIIIIATVHYGLSSIRCGGNLFDYSMDVRISKTGASCRRNLERDLQMHRTCKSMRLQLKFIEDRTASRAASQ
jgi:hypothetical protein